MLLVSACLAGVECRYDGGHNLVEEIQQWVKEGKAILICPEQLGGLTTPRSPAEIIGGTGADVLSGRAMVMDCTGKDVTKEFVTGAYQTLKIAQRVEAKKAFIKESSPSCGGRLIYDGTFQGNKKLGEGVTAALLKMHGIEVFSEQEFRD